MDFEDTFAKRRPIPVLTRTNSDRWFPRMKQWLIGEDLWSVIESQTSVSNTPESSTSFSLNSLGFGNQKINAKALYWLNICISEDDQELLAEKTTAKEVWQSLKTKYEQRLPTNGRQYLAEFAAYKMSPGESIDEAWAYLTKLGRKLATAQPDIGSLNTPERRFQALLQALPEDYRTVRDGIDSQPIIVDEGLSRLQEKEAQLKATETALWAGQHKGGQGSARPYQHDVRYHY